MSRPARCEQIDPTFALLVVTAAQVTPYGTAFRYPPIVVSPTDFDAHEALDAACDALAFVLAHLHHTVHP
jgi:hypothetical protein